ncbi:DUF1343 domain-containing protein [Opitutales bacterium ASA1]|uniref:DUF1343 domain-containing protein n=1 Tax=Congregicoccus parvus TaxID=3081749 RepID=UPI002B2A9F74|nr:DUF1343 domain-containing protein [Opitutales bacterium ASA1]
MFVHRLLAAAAFALVQFVVLACAASGASAPSRSDATQRSAPVTPITTVAPSGQTPARADGVLLGIDVLERQDFGILLGKRVGLLTHPAGVNRFGTSTIDVLRRDPRVRLVSLFGPEHGIYGDEKADKYVPDRVDTRTGLHVYSLYGPTRKPTATMLAGIDVLVIDLQDVGTRSYTYVSCMRLAIEACFEHGVEVVVLDRPNPLGGLKVAGPMLDRDWLSYVGAFRVPYVHGLTIGELARISASQPGVLQIDEDVRRRGRLTVVPMRGWRRTMTWPETGLNWIPTSPNVPTYEAVVGYAMTGLGAQLGGFRHGIGTPHPFRLLTHPSFTSKKLADELNKRRIRGLRFQPRTVTDAQGRNVDGLFVDVHDWNAWRPTELSFHMMQIAARSAPKNPFAAATNAQADLFNKHVGSTEWWKELSTKGGRVELAPFFDAWDKAAKQFQDASRSYWMYP